MEHVDRLLATLTIEEKIGQLNMVPAGQSVTGPGELRDVRRQPAERHGFGMWREVFLVFRNAFQGRSRLLHFFIEFD